MMPPVPGQGAVMLRHVDGPDCEFVTLAEAGRFLGVPARTLRCWVRLGVIPPPRALRENRVKRYSWRLVVAVGILISEGVLPPTTTVPPPKKKPQQAPQKPAEGAH